MPETTNETAAAIEEAIREHIRHESDGTEVMTEFIVIAAAVSPNDQEHTWYYKINPSMPYHSVLGLLERGRELVKGGDGE